MCVRVFRFASNEWRSILPHAASRRHHVTKIKKKNTHTRHDPNGLPDPVCGVGDWEIYRCAAILILGIACLTCVCVAVSARTGRVASFEFLSFHKWKKNDSLNMANRVDLQRRKIQIINDYFSFWIHQKWKKKSREISLNDWGHPATQKAAKEMTLDVFLFIPFSTLADFGAANECRSVPFKRLRVSFFRICFCFNSIMRLLCVARDGEHRCKDFRYARSHPRMRARGRGATARKASDAICHLYSLDFGSIVGSVVFSNFNTRTSSCGLAAGGCRRCFTRIITLFMVDLTVISGVILWRFFFSFCVSRTNGLEMNLNWKILRNFLFRWLRGRCAGWFWFNPSVCGRLGFAYGMAAKNGLETDRASSSPQSAHGESTRYKLLRFIVSHAKRVHATSNLHHRLHWHAARWKTSHSS